jgi:hypothetical protein
MHVNIDTSNGQIQPECTIGKGLITHKHSVYQMLLFLSQNKLIFVEAIIPVDHFSEINCGTFLDSQSFELMATIASPK